MKTRSPFAKNGLKKQKNYNRLNSLKQIGTMNKEQRKQLTILLKLRFEELKRKDIEHPRYENMLAMTSVIKVMDDMSSEQREEYFPTRGKSCNNIPVEEVKERFMTLEELSLWLTEKPHRQCMIVATAFIASNICYNLSHKDDKAESYLIREDGGEWHKPLIKIKD